MTIINEVRNHLAVITDISNPLALKFARRFLEKGFDIFVSGNRPEIDFLREYGRQLPKNRKSSVYTVPVDLREDGGLEIFRKSLIGLKRPVDLVAVNAEQFSNFKTSDLSEPLALKISVKNAKNVAASLLEGSVQKEKGRTQLMVFFPSRQSSTMRSGETNKVSMLN